MTLCPVIILDSLGIVFLPNQKKTIQSTGLISLATIPEGASVFINNKPYSQKTPAIIRNLSEGEYTVRVSLDQYASWEKSVPVAKEQATVLEDIILIPNQWPKDTLLPIMPDRIFYSYDNPYIVFCKGRLLKDIGLFKVDDSIISGLKGGIRYSNKEVIRPLFPGGSKYGSFRLSSVILMPKSSFVLILARDGDKDYYLWADLGDTDSNVLDISRFFTGPVDRILWHYEDSENIFYLSEKNINRINIKENAVYPNIASNIKSFGVFNKRLLAINDSGQFEEYDYVNSSRRSLIGQWSRMPEAFRTPSILKMRILSEKLILFIDDKGKLLSTRLPYELIPSKVSGIGNTLGGNKILIWTKTQLGYVDFAQMKHEGVFEAGPKITWVVKNAKDIQQAFWVNKGSHILFRDTDQIRLAEVNLYPEPSIFDAGYAKGAITYFDRLGKAFFVDRDTKKYISLTIVPEHQMIQFVLPASSKEKKD